MLFMPIKSFIKTHKWIAIAVLILFLFLGYALWPSTPDALLFTVKRGALLIDVPMDGELEAVESFIVKAPSNLWGNIRIVRLVPEGSIVKKGDFLIQFDTSEQVQKLQEAKNKYETTLASLASTKADIQNQMADLESNIKMEKYTLEQARLRAKNAIYEAQNKRLEIELNYKKAQLAYQRLLQEKKSLEKINAAKLRQAQLEVEQARLKLQQAEDNLKKLTITSPADGLVVYEKVWDGGQMSKLKVGYTPWRGQALIEIPSQNRMKVVGSINEIEISRVKKGEKAEIRLDAIKDSVFTGTVSEVATLAHKDRETDKNVFDVEILINETDSRLKPGMTAHCKIIVQKLENVLTIPIDAVQLKGGKSVVYNAHGKAVAIETGASNGDFVVVRKGLQEGERIQLRTSNRKAVSVKKEKPAPRPRTSQKIIIVG